MGSYVGDIPVMKEPPRISQIMLGQEGVPDLLSRYQEFLMIAMAKEVERKNVFHLKIRADLTCCR